VTESPKQSHPALQYLKDNAVVIGLIVIVAVSVAFFAVTQAKAEAKPAAETRPAPVATAALDGSASPGAPSATGATPSPTGTATAQPAAAGSQSASQPLPTATPSQAILGKGVQAVTAKDWRGYAEAFSKAWATTSDGKDAWLGRLKPMVSPDLYAGFTRTDISTIPTDPYENISMAEESKASKTFRAYSTHGQMFEGRVSVQADGSWVVDQVGPPAK
jgi:hypothetical protein